MLLGSIFPRSDRLKVVDLSYGHSYDTYSILIPVSNEVTLNSTAVIKPFQWMVITFLTLVLTIIAFIVLTIVLIVSKISY